MLEGLIKGILFMGFWIGFIVIFKFINFCIFDFLRAYNNKCCTYNLLTRFYDLMDAICIYIILLTNFTQLWNVIWVYFIKEINCFNFSHFTTNITNPKQHLNLKKSIPTQILKFQHQPSKLIINIIRSSNSTNCCDCNIA